MTLLLAVSRADVSGYVITLMYVYVVLIFIRVLMSWMPRVPYSRPLNIVLKFVSDVVDPYLNLFRRILPPVRLGPGALDLSPIVGTLVVFIVGTFVAAAIHG